MSTDKLNLHEIEQLETQAKQMAGLLDANAQRLSMRTLKQLEDCRAKAIKIHEQHQNEHVANADGTFSQLTAWADHHRLAFVSLIAATVVMLFIITQSLMYSETSDAYLLSAELPPEAFVDRGFEPSLNRSENI